MDPSDELVTTGLFAWVRNPIYTAMLTTLLGLVPAVPNVLAAVAFFVAFVGLELHVRKVEELYLLLLRLHPERLRAYARRVGRFVPRIGRIASRRLGPTNLRGVFAKPRLGRVDSI